MLTGRQLLNETQREVLRHKGLDPHRYWLVRELPESLILWNIPEGRHEIVRK